MLFRRTKIWADQCFWQDVHLFVCILWDFTLLRRIRQNQLFLYRMFQRLIQHHMNALHHAGTQPVFFQLRLVFLLYATTLKQFVVKLLDLQHRQLFQLHTVKLRNDRLLRGDPNYGQTLCVQADWAA